MRRKSQIMAAGLYVPAVVFLCHFRLVPAAGTPQYRPFCYPPAACVRQKGAAGMMTLKELKTKINHSPGYRRGMTERELKRSGGKIVACCQLDSETWIRVYNNGGVIFCDGKRKTIFSVHDCSKACWDFAMSDGYVLDGDEYEEVPWNVCLYLEGMKRIEKNIEKSIAKTTIVTSDEKDPFFELPYFEDGFSEVEWKDFLERVMEDLSPEQAMILQCCVLGDQHQADLAKDLGVSQGTISKKWAMAREIIARKLLFD